MLLKRGEGEYVPTTGLLGERERLICVSGKTGPRDDELVGVAVSITGLLSAALTGSTYGPGAAALGCLVYRRFIAAS